MTTDTDALTERLWDAIFQSRDTEDKSGEAPTEKIVAAVLPTVAAEVRKAKAEALREAARVMGEWACESLVVIGDELDESTWVEMTAGEWLEHRAAEYETGGSDEHR